jgi:hypothetical protein
MTNYYTDAALTESAAQTIGGSFGNKPTGYARAAGYLLTVPEEVRSQVASEARIRSNVIGGRYADQVHTVVTNWLAGRQGFPYLEANRAMLARE